MMEGHRFNLGVADNGSLFIIDGDSGTWVTPWFNADIAVDTAWVDIKEGLKAISEGRVSELNLDEL